MNRFVPAPLIGHATHPHYVVCSGVFRDHSFTKLPIDWETWQTKPSARYRE